MKNVSGKVGANLLLLLLSTSIALVLLEIGLRVFTPLPVTTESNRADDPRLGYVMARSYPGVDERGFRNPPGAFDVADLVFVGDSHTFGYNVGGEQSFPSVVARETGRHVYNFGIGSYCIYQYAVLLEEAAKMQHVHDVVLALYLANDLSSPCRATRTDYWRNRAAGTGIRLPDCGNDPTIPAREKLSRMLEQTAAVQAVQLALESEMFVSGDTHFLFDHSIRVDRARAAGHSRAASLADPQVQLNFENARRFLVESQQRFDTASIGFVVLFIPSKELVVNEWLRQRGIQPDAEFDAVVASERTLTEAFGAFLDEAGIVYLDALPILVRGLADAAAAGEPFYKPNDGHPLARGYAVYADASLAALDRLHHAR